MSEDKKPGYCTELRRDPASGNWTIVHIRKERKDDDEEKYDYQEYHRYRDCTSYITSPERRRNRLEYTEKSCVWSKHFFRGNRQDKEALFGLRYAKDRERVEITENNWNLSDWEVYVVRTDYAQVVPKKNTNNFGSHMFESEAGYGLHDLIINDSTESHLPLGVMDEKRTQLVFMAMLYRLKGSVDGYPDLASQMKSAPTPLEKEDGIRHVAFFHNHRREAGGSLEHPHSQIIASSIIPYEVSEELKYTQKRYEQPPRRCVYCEIIDAELARRNKDSKTSRVLFESEHFLAIHPFAPKFPFETWIIPKSHTPSFGDINTNPHRNDGTCSELSDLSIIVNAVLGRLYVCLDDPGYNLLVKTQPIRQKDESDDKYAFYHWHIRILPRGLTIPAGYELSTGISSCPTPPNETCAFLRKWGVLSENATVPGSLSWYLKDAQNKVDKFANEDNKEEPNQIIHAPFREILAVRAVRKLKNILTIIGQGQAEVRIFRRAAMVIKKWEEEHPDLFLSENELPDEAQQPLQKNEQANGNEGSHYHRCPATGRWVLIPVKARRVSPDDILKRWLREKSDAERQLEAIEKPTLLPMNRKGQCDFDCLVAAEILQQNIHQEKDHADMQTTIVKRFTRIYNGNKKNKNRLTDRFKELEMPEEPLRRLGKLDKKNKEKIDRQDREIKHFISQQNANWVGDCRLCSLNDIKRLVEEKERINKRNDYQLNTIYRTYYINYQQKIDQEMDNESLDRFYENLYQLIHIVEKNIEEADRQLDTIERFSSLEECKLCCKCKKNNEDGGNKRNEYNRNKHDVIGCMVKRSCDDIDYIADVKQQDKNCSKSNKCLRIIRNSNPILQNMEKSGNKSGIPSIASMGLFESIEGLGRCEVFVPCYEHSKSKANNYTPNNKTASAYASKGNIGVDKIELLLSAVCKRISDIENEAANDQDTMAISPIRHVAVFSNHGEGAGAKLAHENWQLVASPIVPTTIEQELNLCEDYSKLNSGRCCYCDMIDIEKLRHEKLEEYKKENNHKKPIDDKSRLIQAGEWEHFVVIAPFASKSPFEIWIMPKDHRKNIRESIWEEKSKGNSTRRGNLQPTAIKRKELASILKSILSIYADALNDTAFTLTIQNAPIAPVNDPQKYHHYHWRIVIEPRRIVIHAGFEHITGIWSNVVPPEEAADFLNKKLEEKKKLKKEKEDAAEASK